MSESAERVLWSLLEADGPQVDGLHVVYQPVVGLKHGDLLGYEAFLRGPVATALALPLAMLATAHDTGQRAALECRALDLAMKGFGRLNSGDGQLFVNLSASVLADASGLGVDAVLRSALTHGVPPSRLVIDLAGYESVPQGCALPDAWTQLERQGVLLCLDDFGIGSLCFGDWIQLAPAFVKLDGRLIRSIDGNGRKVDVVSALVDIARRFGCQLIAECVETEAELSILRDLGVDHVQGSLVAVPKDAPGRFDLTATVRKAISAKTIAVLPESVPAPDLTQTVERLMIEAPCVTPETQNDDLLHLFVTQPWLHAIAVVENGFPVGLISRVEFSNKFAQPYQRELFGRRTCVGNMNPKPLRIEISTSIDSLASVLMGSDQRYLQEGLIVTRQGAYAGLATGESLVRSVTEQRVEAARHANPLTLLPGNIPITEHIRRLLNASVPFAAAYFDLNNFKPFNDLYGYWKGDEMIRLCAAAIQATSRTGTDFVGHVGGDDFVVLYQSEDWLTRCQAAVTGFNERARSLFDPDDLARDGFESEDRKGNKVIFRLTTVAAGVVLVSPGAYGRPEQVASAAASAKKAAKMQPDGLFVLRQIDT